MTDRELDELLRFERLARARGPANIGERITFVQRAHRAVPELVRVVRQLRAAVAATPGAAAERARLRDALAGDMEIMRQALELAQTAIQDADKRLERESYWRGCLDALADVLELLDDEPAARSAT